MSKGNLSLDIIQDCQKYNIMNKDYVDFLRQHQLKDKNIKPTHTKIGSREGNDIHYGGKYYIPDDEMPKFYQYYYNVIMKENKKEFLTELQLRNESIENCGPMLLDLDFKFRPDMEERFVDCSLYEDIINIYIDKLCKYFDLKNGDTIPVWVMQKKHMVQKDEFIKDGLHIVFGIKVPHMIQLEIRKDVMDDFKSLIQDDEDEPVLINTIDDVLDYSISSGSTGWQVYGSRKPNHEPYQLVGYYTVIITETEMNGCDLIPDLKMNDVESYLNEGYMSFYKMSARYTGHKSYDLKDEYKMVLDKEKIYNEEKEQMSKSSSLIKTTYNFEVSSIDSIDTLKQMNELLLKEDEYNYKMRFKEVYECVMYLPYKYYTEYYWWIRVGWALKNTDERLFLTWMEFSSQSDKFSIDDISKYYEMWSSEMKHRGLTERSIKYWLKQEFPKKYETIKNDTIEYLMRQSVNDFNDHNVAMVIFHLYRDDYRCPDIKNKVWYRYRNHRWEEINSGSSLRILISKHVSRLYSKKADELLTYNSEQQKKKEVQQLLMESVVDDSHSVANTEATVEKTESYFDKIRKVSQTYNKISNKLGNNAFKNNIMRELADLFNEEDPHFYSKLDSNPYLLCFNNGVFDFEEGIFRNGRPDDHVSKTTNIDYIPLNNDEHKDTIEEILDFMERLFPQKDLNRYMWEHLASTLIGYNRNQTFNIYNGCGRNGKTKLVELMSAILGDYKGVVPSTLVTGRRIGIGGTSSEIAMLKGIRYAVMQEPTKNDKLNDGIMKELTGGDPITGRSLFKEPVTFVPQFKLVVCTNNLFDVNTNDDGTWRRIRLCDFMSKFVEDPDKEKSKSDGAYYFKVDKNIDRKFNDWKEIFMSMLVEIALKKKGLVDDCDIVLSASRRYRQSQDYITQFIDQNIIPYEECSIRIKDLQTEYKMWCDMNTVNIKKFPFKEVREQMNKQYDVKNTYWIHCRLKSDIPDDEIDEIN